MRTLSGRIRLNMLLVTILGALAPGISAAPITTSAANTSSSVVPA